MRRMKYVQAGLAGRRERGAMIGGFDGRLGWKLCTGREPRQNGHGFLSRVIGIR